MNHLPLDDDLLFHDKAQASWAEELKEGLRRFNDDKSPAHRDVRGQTDIAIEHFVSGKNGQLVGGVLAHVRWRWLSIDDIWVTKNSRGRGLGRRLLHFAEQRGRALLCQRAMVKTWDFQAPAFYKRLGYEPVGQLKDYPPGQTLYWLQKHLSS